MKNNIEDTPEASLELVWSMPIEDVEALWEARWGVGATVTAASVADAGPFFSRALDRLISVALVERVSPFSGKSYITPIRPCK